MGWTWQTILAEGQHVFSTVSAGDMVPKGGGEQEQEQEENVVPGNR